jgi:hypothetical protein
LSAGAKSKVPAVVRKTNRATRLTTVHATSRAMLGVSIFFVAIFPSFASCKAYPWKRLSTRQPCQNSCTEFPKRLTAPIPVRATRFAPVPDGTILWF